MNWFVFTVATCLLWLPNSSFAFSKKAPLTKEQKRYGAQVNSMIENQILKRGVKDSRVLKAMSTTPRHEFVPQDLAHQAYSDGPLPIGFKQTISQPYIVAAMTEAAQLKAKSKVLEIGTGSGYQAAVLSGLVKDVYTIEILQGLATQAKEKLVELGYRNIHTRIGDGYKGWTEEAPFDAIIVTAAPNHIPPALKEQLKVGGRLIIPVGESFQKLLRITKIKTKKGIEYKQESLLPVRFVPMTGEADQQISQEDNL